MCQWFAPTSLVVSFEKEGRGCVLEQDIERIVERDKAGQVVALHLPQKAVLVSNHQVCTWRTSTVPVVPGRLTHVVQTYGDWWYDWCLTYYMGTHKDVFIVLKKSLKWIPLLGWVSSIATWDEVATHARQGNAIFQLHIPCPFVGVRSPALILKSRLAGSPFTAGRHAIDVHSLSGGHLHQQRYKTAE